MIRVHTHARTHVKTKRVKLVKQTVMESFDSILRSSVRMKIRGHVWNLEWIFINNGRLGHSFMAEAHSFMLATKSSPFLMEPLSSARASDTSFSSNAESFPRPRFFSIPFFWNTQKELNYISLSLLSEDQGCVRACVIPQAAKVWRNIYTPSPLISQTHTPPLLLSRSWHQEQRKWSELQRKPSTEWQNLKHTKTLTFWYYQTALVSQSVVSFSWTLRWLQEESWAFTCLHHAFIPNGSGDV